MQSDLDPEDSVTLPRGEYPRPQFVRSDWLCLNGEWEFEIDSGDSGLERGLLERPLTRRIVVPFCPESPLSGVHHTDFMPAVWYRRTVNIPRAWAGWRILLHFQAVDYDCTVWVNGIAVGRHRGGFTPFTCDLTDAVTPGQEAIIVVRARDDNIPPQARGKQSQRYANYRCLYTRTTGIWQTVWLEPVPIPSLRRPRLTPDVANRLIRLDQPITNQRRGTHLRASLRDPGGSTITKASCAADSDFTPRLDLRVPEDHYRLWSPRDPYLYAVDLQLIDSHGTVVDQAMSYAGLRSITIEGEAVRINGEVVFQRLVLDQGYYPDGIMTAPSDDALRRDIVLAKSAGFNGARLHQKVFEERFLFHADRLGYLVWGEFADWGCQGYGPAEDHTQPGVTYVTQWLEVIERDYSHPCIVGWCPLNETSQPITDRFTTLDDTTQALFLATKAMDSTRPVLDASGYSHRAAESDIYDCHDYEQNPTAFSAHHAGLGSGLAFYNGPPDRSWSISHGRQPFFVSEFGGIWWNPEAGPGEDSWGYGDRPRTIEEFYERFEQLTAILLDNPHMFGYCYTQLTDVYQEQNGIYSFDRRSKFDLERVRRAQERPAAIET